MSAHTPGPWRVSAGIVDNPRLIVESDMGLAVCALSLRGVQGDLARMAANARLIAAAPDLIEALQAVLDDITTPDEQWAPGTPVERARKAIARATGEAS